MTSICYKGYRYDSLAQVILALMDHAGGEIDFEDIHAQLADYPLVNESKIRERLRLLEESNLVNVRTSPRPNINDKKFYDLNRNGRALIDHHDLILPVSLQNQLDIEYLIKHAEAAEGYIRYLVKDLHNEEI